LLGLGSRDVKQGEILEAEAEAKTGAKRRSNKIKLNAVRITLWLLNL